MNKEIIEKQHKVALIYELNSSLVVFFFGLVILGKDALLAQMYETFI